MKRLACTLAAAGTLLVSLVPLFTGTALAAEPGNQYFQRTWQRTDLPVADLLVSRTWMWGPEAATDLMVESYDEAPGAERSVQYFDKSRMEITNPSGDSGSVWYVTNGLLVVELITGEMQVGDNRFEPRQPAEVPVAGDGNDINGPTYATFATVLDAQATPVGTTLTNRIARSGQITSDPSLAVQGVQAGFYDDVTGHTIAQPFWGFMNSSGMVYENGQYADDSMFESPLFATGRPITEAYWAEVLIAGTPTDVLMQCFERRCLTFNPSNGAGWQVEAGNVGSHYYEWRYGSDEEPGNVPPPGNEPPSDPGPGDPPPGDPPPGNPPPSNPPENAPAAPVNLTAEFEHRHGPDDFDPWTPLIALTWDDVSNDEQGFQIYYGLYGEQLSPLGNVPANTVMYDWHDGTPGKEYCFAVTAIGADGESAPSSTACAEWPGGPRLLEPVDGYVAYERELTFRWTPVDGADSYVVCLYYPNYADEECGGSVRIGSGDGHAVYDATELTWEISPWLADSGERTDFIWTVAACHDGYCVPADHYRDLTLDLSGQLDAPRLIAPEDDAVVHDRMLTFEYEPVNGANGYVLCIIGWDVREYHCDFDMTPQNTQLYWHGGPGANGSFEVELDPQLAPENQGTTLYWTVAACASDAYDCTGQGIYYELHWDPTYAIPAPELEAPVLDYSEVDLNDPGRYVFHWHLSDGAETYQLCVYAPGADCAAQGGQTYKSAPLGPAVDVYPMDIPLWLAPDGYVTELRWTVAACDAYNDCVWQQNYQTIHVDRVNQQQLVAPTLDSPANGYVTGDSPLYLNWNPVPGAASYRVCLAYDAGDSCPYNQTFWSSYLDPSETSWTVYNAENTYTELEWTVAACDAANNCVWQENAWTVTIDRLGAPLLAAPALVSPQNGYQTADRRIDFEWAGVTGAETYIVCAYVSGGNCENNSGLEYKSSTLGPGVRTYPLTIPVHLAPDDVTTDIYWKVAACDSSNNCAWQPSYRWIVLSPDMEAPHLVGPNAGYETTERRVVFEWDLVPDATSYQICVAAPGDSCRDNPVDVYKSSPLGPTVTTYPLDIPYWLAPDGERTQVNWVVGACYANGNCVWQMAYHSLYVDLR